MPRSRATPACSWCRSVSGGTCPVSATASRSSTFPQVVTAPANAPPTIGCHRPDPWAEGSPAHSVWRQSALARRLQQLFEVRYARSARKPIRCVADQPCALGPGCPFALVGFRGEPRIRVDEERLVGQSVSTSSSLKRELRGEKRASRSHRVG